MTSEIIQSKLDELLINPKTKNFINHLVRNYIPMSKISTVYEEPTKDFTCIITKKNLMSGKNSSSSNEKLKEPVSSLPDDEQLALTGQDTNTYMSYRTYKEFYKWVVNKVIVYDKHILWLMGDFNKREFIDKFNGIETKQQNNKNHIKPKTERAKYTLGDLGVLQELKNKMNS